MNSMTKAAAAAVFTFAVGLAVPASAKDCDRTCLTGVMDDYIAAMVAHKPGDAPLAKSIVTVENAKRISTGEGLWKAATKGPDSFKIYVPDEVTQQVGGMFMIEEEGKPALIGLRLKLDDKGKIVEAEHMVARNLREGVMANLETPRAAFSQEVPEAYRDSRSRLVSIALSYYDALDENNGAMAPFADDCVRRENGIQTARNPVPTGNADDGFGYLGALGCEAQMNTLMWTYITKIDNRRVLTADPVTGLAIGFSHFHHAFTQKTFRLVGVPGQDERKMDYEPFDLPAMHIYKIWGGKIHEIEAMGFTAPYNIPTGWEK
jgi:hypothetical protein